MAEARHLPEVAAYWRAVVDINTYQTTRFTNRILAALNNTLANKSIAVLGYAYKKDTSDTRESAAITVVGQLIAENARVRIYDPKVQAAQIRRDLEPDFTNITLDKCLTVCPDAYTACDRAAAILVLTEWDEFRTDRLVLPSVLTNDSIERLQAGFNKSGLVSPASSEELSSPEDTDSDNTIVGISGRQSRPTNDPLPPPSSSPISSDRVDWTRIADLVRRPRLVFDGRNIIEPLKLKALGFKVHSIGNAGFSGKGRNNDLHI